MLASGGRSELTEVNVAQSQKKLIGSRKLGLPVEENQQVRAEGRYRQELADVS